MWYPEDMTQDDIMEFEYEYNRLRDIEEGRGFWLVNAECQVVADLQRATELDRDWDEPYEPDVDRFDAWYDEQYEIEDF